MTKAQILVIFLALALFLGLYLGFDTKPSAQKKLEEAPLAKGEGTSFESLLADAKSHADAALLSAVKKAESEADSTNKDAERVAALKQLSALWYNADHIPLAGVYAEKVAEIEKADTAWSVVGATFYNALIASQEPAVRDFCAQHARHAFETASTLNPGKPEHTVNLALVYAENPPPDNPMKAVLMLRDLEKKYPESPAVYNALGRLAIKTGQWQRAIDRLEKAWSLDKTNFNTPCLLAKAYEGAGQMDKSAEFAKICNK
jgi:tetratricopeptide (TPR) repeat protein